MLIKYNVLVLRGVFSSMVWFMEYVGYFASVLCVISLMMKDIKKLRWLNLIASAIFVVYSAFKVAYPVVVTNLIIVFIDLYYIIKLNKER